MKKRILLIVMVFLITQTFSGRAIIKAKEIVEEPHEKRVYIDIFEDQTISDINNVSFNLVQDEQSCISKSDTDLDIDEVQKTVELDRQIGILNQIEDTYEWFVKYKELKEEFSTIFIEENEHKQITDEYTEEQIYYIERMVETETHGCSFDAHVNVANVVFNRIKHEKFPDDPISVVTSPSQFCYGCTNISESVKLAVEYAYMFPDTTNGAIYFHSGRRTKTFNKKPLVHEDDAVHYFYG